jgi:hypothetical protein
MLSHINFLKAAAFIAIFALPCSAAAADFHNALSLQGFTGILNTPTAFVTDEGKGYALYSNQIENNWRNSARTQDNYLFSIGLYDHVEIGGRLVDAPGSSIRDLSFNAKIQIPFIPKDSLLPQLAVGVQDISSGSGVANRLKTWYGVASKDFWRFRFSAGYGTGPKRMDGLFGGAELKTYDWFYLLGDYDTKETNVGARVVTPELFGYPVNLQLTAKTSVDYRPGNFEVAAGLQFPLGLNHHSKTPIQLAALPVETTVPGQVAPSDKADQQPAPVGSKAKLHALHGKLTAQGFQDLRIGTLDKTILLVEFENNRYNQNELDAFGVVAGTILASLPEEVKEVRLISKKKGIRMLQLSAPVAAFRNFYRDANAIAELQSSLRISEDSEDVPGIDQIDGKGRTTLLHSSLVLAPGLKTYLGSDVAPFDYLLSLKPELYLNTWKGAVVNARWDIPLAWSENFDDGKPFRGDRQTSQLDRLMLFQALKPAPGLMVLLGGGMVTHDAYGTDNQAAWYLGEGRHRFKVMQLYTEDDKHLKRQSYRGAYRYYHAPLETYLEATGGKFWGQDKGYMLELKRFFGDTALTVYYKNTLTEDNVNHQAAGLQLSLPLTPRRDMLPYPLQVRGTEEWSYSQETKINSKENFVGGNTGIKPEPAFNIDRVFYNRDRLSEGYIREHLLRLRDAYQQYGLGE